MGTEPATAPPKALWLYLVHIFWVGAVAAQAALLVKHLAFAEELNVGAEELYGV